MFCRTLQSWYRRDHEHEDEGAAGSGFPDLAISARAGRFDDVESDEALPKTLLVQVLEERGAHALADCVRSGEFDNTPEEWRAATGGGG